MPMQLVDIIIHKLKINTCWEDYYRFGFYRGNESWEERSLYVGYSGSKYWPWAGNSLKFDQLFVSKSLQKSILMAHEIPTPRLLAKVGRNYATDTREKFQTVMANVDKPFMAKFDGGGSGVHVYGLTPENGEFRYGERLVDSDWIWAQFEPVIHQGFLIEEQSSNHPVMHEVYPGSLNTIRLTTVKTVDGKWHLLLPYIKFGRGGAQVDNMTAGGLFAGIDASGRVGLAYSVDASDTFERHPDTGIPITGLRLPFFEEAKKLALAASKIFGFMNSIAWDVGLTPTGPVIIEGNHYWDPQDVQDKLGPFLTREVIAGLPSRSWWTPWDRTHMYPNYTKYTHGGMQQRPMANQRHHVTKKRETEIRST